jgi:excisionase family DNA binding protein
MELLTIQETAQMLKVNPITIRRFIADGRLEAVRIGGGYVYAERSLTSWRSPSHQRPPRRREPAGRFGQ